MTFLIGRSQRFEFCRAKLLAFFDKPQPFTHDFAGGGVAAAIDEILNQCVVLFADAVAGSSMLIARASSSRMVHGNRIRIPVCFITTPERSDILCSQGVASNRLGR